ncbi:DSD1 family PLP-dependent enzyme [Xenorhabdus sp. KK7.4]|uniref:DSD1 family PLP-dependent enzyme n=1 Tax=Xenorhabdus sp. KK7.4 TaxID=1851572 RepID=UPI000C03E04E|nr:DSD1 family PLP-dependent enzyme [Xenorhabdus sp. KK7.4]PHM56846.1 D-threo-3-hydroxyaspartate dehydratase [Xenorhabdus sp. KK7.4]
MSNSDWLSLLETPFLLIDESRFIRNIDRLYNRIGHLGSHIRPHLKTLRSPEAAKYLLKDSSSPATVSTLAEAEGFVKAGYTNILYAVGIAPHKLARVTNLLNKGINIHILLDTPEQALAVAEYAKANSVIFSVFIEIDCDDHRGGLQPDSDELIKLAKMVDGNGATLTGLLTHAGGSYSCQTGEQLRVAAKAECDAVRQAARRIREAGIACPILSVGSTPTAHYVEDLTGITEVRAGVFSTFDLVMKNVGVCTLDDIAMSVVTTVIGRNKEKGWILIDAGWMAMSRDRGTAEGPIDYGYGQVCNLNGYPYPGLCVSMTNQEHGIIVLPAESSMKTEDFPVGTRLRILPNHACATASMHLQYQILKQGSSEQETWHRITGW